MLSELGNLFLAMALGFAAVQSLSSFWGVNKYNSNVCHSELISGSCKMLKQVHHDNKSWFFRRNACSTSYKYLALGRVAAFLQAGFLGAAFVTLIIAFIVCDFSIVTVAFHGHTQLPWYYRFAAAWGNHEGSLLLFILVLAGLSCALAACLNSSLFRARALVIQGLLTVLFLIFLMGVSNPFTSLPFPLTEGISLNPLLQDRGLLIHPPLLYLGYVGFSAPFSLALAALWGEESVETFTAATRPWVLFAWAALTAGIALGSWWAYYELGWGGWWFWDPVENASFMPWLSGTALLHMLLTKKFYRWSLFLSLLTFGLSLLGTFLVRSGLMISVHSFVQDPERGLFILGILTGVMGFAFFFWIWKLPRLQRPSVDLLSRDGALLSNSLLLFLGLGTVLLGTLYPLLTDFIGGEKIAIGSPYFERTFIPLILPLFFLLPIGVLLRKEKKLFSPLLFAPLTAVLGCVVLILYFFYPLSLLAFVGITAAIWILGGTIVAFKENKLSFGATVAHIGVAVSLLGVSVGEGFRNDELRILQPKESLNVGGINLTFQKVEYGKEPTYVYERAILTFPGGVLAPEKRLYKPQNSLLSETAIQTNGLRDLYAILGPYQGENKWLIKASYIPLAPWIWLGGALMAFGAFFSFFEILSKSKPELLRFLRSLAVLNPAKVGNYAFLKLSPGLKVASKAKKSISSMVLKKIANLFMTLALLSSPLYAAESLKQRAHDLYQEVRCPVCLGQSIADSETPEAEALKDFILMELKKGESEEAIREKLRIHYGQSILLRPFFSSQTYLLWCAPFILFFLAIGILFWQGFQSRAKKGI